MDFIADIEMLKIWIPVMRVGALPGDYLASLQRPAVSVVLCTVQYSLRNDT